MENMEFREFSPEEFAKELEDKIPAVHAAIESMQRAQCVTRELLDWEVTI